MNMADASRHAVCELPPDPIEVMRVLQEIATSHPELADRLKPASDLVAAQNAMLLDIHRGMRASRLVEHFG